MTFRIAPHTAAALLALYLGLGHAPAAFAQMQTGADGQAAFDQGDYASARDIWAPLAKKGSAEAMRGLAQLYRLGLGVEADDAKAYEYFAAAAQRGLADAAVSAGFMLLKGEGVEKNPKRAAALFAAAAEAGDATAQYNLGLMYESGTGLDADLALARKWYTRAASQGHGRSIARLEALETEGPVRRMAEEKPEAEATHIAAKPSAKPATADETTKAAMAKPESEGADAAMAAPKPAATKPALSIARLEPQSSYRPAAEMAPESDRAAAPMPAPRPEPKAAGARARQDAEAPFRAAQIALQTAKPDDMRIEPVGETTMTKEGASGAMEPIGAFSIAVARPQTPVPASLPQATPPQKEMAAPIMITPRAMAAAPKIAAPAMVQPMTTAPQPATMADSVKARLGQAQAAYDRGDYAAAGKLWAALADEGVLDAAFYLGRLYNRGEGTPLNRVRAYEIWSRVADQGSDKAATALANLRARMTDQELSAAMAGGRN